MKIVLKPVKDDYYMRVMAGGSANHWALASKVWASSSRREVYRLDKHFYLGFRIARNT